MVEDDGRDVPMPLPSEWYEDHLVIADQKESEDEFLVDALYLTKANTLACKAGNKTCFETKNIGAMKKHRETVHPFLEQRFPVEIWRDLLPEVLLREMEETTELAESSSSGRGQSTKDPEDPVSQSQTSASEDHSGSRKELGKGPDDEKTKHEDDLRRESQPVIRGKHIALLCTVCCCCSVDGRDIFTPAPVRARVRVRTQFILHSPSLTPSLPHSLTPSLHTTHQSTVSPAVQLNVSINVRLPAHCSVRYFHDD